MAFLSAVGLSSTYIHTAHTYLADGQGGRDVSEEWNVVIDIQQSNHQRVVSLKYIDTTVSSNKKKIRFAETGLSVSFQYKNLCVIL